MIMTRAVDISIQAVSPVSMRRSSDTLTRPGARPGLTEG